MTVSPETHLHKHRTNNLAILDVENVDDERKHRKEIAKNEKLGVMRRKAVSGK